MPTAHIFAAVLLAVSSVGCGTNVTPARDLVYTSFYDHQIWRMRPDGSEARPATAPVEGAIESMAVWSPDGRLIAFRSNRHRSDRQAIFIMDADGTNVRRVGPDSIAYQTAPDFSPAGARIVFVGGASPGEPYLYAMNVDGSDLRRLIVADAPHFCPRWSPDGARILFTSDQDQLRVVEVASGRVSGILPTGMNGHCGDWSPDGSKVAFASGPDGSLPTIQEIMAEGITGIEIYVLDLGNMEVQHFPQAGPLSNYPRWSRDGQRIVFQRLQVEMSRRPAYEVIWEDTEIYSMASDGSDIQALTSNSVTDLHPNW